LLNEEIIVEEYQPEDTNDEKINEDNIIIIDISNIPLILQNYPRNIPKYNTSKVSDNNKSEPYMAPQIRSQKTSEKQSNITLNLTNYIEDYNLNNYILVFIVYITTIEDTKELEPESELIIIAKSRAEGLEEPKLYKEAVNSNYKNYWFKSEAKEFDTLNNNNTYELVLKPKGVKVLSSRWVYKFKDKSEFYEFKSRFVAKNFIQKYNINYIDTFVNVIK
jgi:hypothetical protein